MVDEEKEFVKNEDPLLDDVLNEVYEWYGSMLPVAIDHWTFPRFAAKSREFAERLAAHIPMEVSATAPTAYTDGKVITMPALYLIPKFYEAYGIEYRDMTLASCALFNAIQIHEALHCRVTRFTMIDFCRDSGIAEAFEFIEKYEGFKTILNIVEDAYIEEYCRRNFAGLAKILALYKPILMGEYALQMALAHRSDPDELTVEEIVGLLTFQNNSAIRYDERLNPIAELVDIIHMGVRNLKFFSADGYLDEEWQCTLAERAQTSVDIFKKLMDTFPEEVTAQQPQPEPGDGEGDDGSSPFDRVMDGSESGGSTPPPEPQKGFFSRPSTSGRWMDLDELMDGIAKAIAEGIDDRELENAATALMEAIRELKEEAEEKEREKDDPKKELSEIVHLGRHKMDHIPPMIITDVMNSDSSPKAVAPIRSWMHFGTYLRYQREEKTTLGLPTTKGSVVVKTRLARIVTDGKVLAKRDNKKVQRGKPFVSLLLDASGSMGGHVGDGSDMSLFDLTVASAYGMFEALRRAGVPVAVYAHTSPSHSSGIRPLLYKVAAFRMPMMSRMAITHGDYANRFAKLAGVRKVENFDGFAIEAVAGQFPSEQGTKTVIVLSDGAPVASGMYSGTPAQDHTRMNVLKARKAGIHVISISLVESVVSTNDAIYGKDNNFHGFGSNLQHTLRELAGALTIPSL